MFQPKYGRLPGTLTGGGGVRWLPSGTATADSMNEFKENRLIIIFMYSDDYMNKSFVNTHQVGLWYCCIISH